MSLSKQRMDSQDYIVAKLEEIHDDVQELKTHVDLLRQESAERRIMWKVLLGAAGTLGALTSWLLSKLPLLSH